MNLIQIQEHLKDLPTQAIMGYANGQNPEVPPYMALGEMNRRKAMEQRAAQAPDTSVKEKLESELSQQVALPGIGQGMNMRINPAGMPQPMPAAQPQMAPQMPKMPIQPAARPTPPQQMAQPGVPPGGMAAGGLAELPVRKDIFSYAPGGIVAFADEDNEQVVPDVAESMNEGSAEMAGLDKLPVSLANRILASRLQGDNGVPKVVDPEEIKKRYIAQHPEQAEILNSVPGAGITKLIEALATQDAAQKQKFQEGEGTRGLASLSNALINAGEATRGQKGTRGQLGAAFGGFGKSFNASTADTLQREANQQALERARTIETMKLKSDVENLQRAYAEGNVAKIAEYEKAVRARQEKISVMQGGAAKDVLTQYGTQLQREEQSKHNRAIEAQAKRNADAAASNAAINRENRQTGEEKNTLRVMSILQADPDYKKILEKRNEYSPDSPEFNAYQDYLDEKTKAAYSALKLTPPATLPRLKAPAPKPEEQGFWDKFLNGPKPTSPAKPSEVPLPPGFKIVQ
jgi:hypothetical protein